MDELTMFGEPVAASDLSDAYLIEQLQQRGYRVLTADGRELPALRDADEFGVSFDTFWERYPRKVSKQQARKAWQALSAGERSLAYAVIEDHVALWWREGRGLSTVPHASTWLNQQRFHDELRYVAPRDERRSRQEKSQDAIAAVLRSEQPSRGELPS